MATQGESAMFKQYRAQLGNEEVLIETGKLAPQAGGAVTVRMGDSVVFVAATASDKPREGIDFFPLTVDVEERRYAAGSIPGGFFKREGRPSTETILLCRTIDRPIRPLFPQGYRNDVQIIVMPLSADSEHQLDVLASIGASAALMISDIPFDTPLGTVRIGYIDGAFVINPTESQMPASELDLVVTASQESVLMIEAGASQFPEAQMLEAIRLAHRTVQGTIAVQRQMAQEIGKEKRLGIDFSLSPELVAKVESLAKGALSELVNSEAARSDRRERQAEIKANVMVAFEPADHNAASEAFEHLFSHLMRERILDTGVRIDGRDLNTIRELKAEVGLLPRTHGSSLFTRGETQVMNIVTLGSASDEQKIELLSGGTARKAYMHHYNFPPYSTGEAYPLRGPRRREIGHGALAERAIIPVLPSADEFPYTIRSVSEAMSSNGSTSMASTCSSSLALFDAGVPLKAPVAGIAMGVITSGDRFAVLTDIQGLEDHLGDMDFKVTGTTKGITAIQLDIKIGGLKDEIIVETLARAREARLRILEVMNAALAAPRAELSQFAPRIQTIKIPVEKIGKVIGPGGKTIRSIIEATGVSIDVADDGTVSVASADGESAQRALAMISELTEEAEIGRVYTGKVVRIEAFGAFVAIMPNVDGLVHISQLSDHRVERVEDEVRLGDEIMVMVVDVDPAGKIRLSRQAVMEGWTPEEAQRRSARPARRSGGDDRRGGSRDRDDRDDRRRRD
jgi:polyribonucleotide nucleotidyltransferase